MSETAAQAAVSWDHVQQVGHCAGWLPRPVSTPACLVLYWPGRQPAEEAGQQSTRLVTTPASEAQGMLGCAPAKEADWRSTRQAGARSGAGADCAVTPDVEWCRRSHGAQGASARSNAPASSCVARTASATVQSKCLFRPCFLAPFSGRAPGA